MTMDGDEVRKKGTVAGGYRDPNRSKMQLAKGYKVGSPLFLALSWRWLSLLEVARLSLRPYPL